MKASAVTPDRAQKSPSRGGAGGRMTNSAGKTNFGDSVRLLISPMEAVTVKEAVRRLKESIPNGVYNHINSRKRLFCRRRCLCEG